MQRAFQFWALLGLVVFSATAAHALPTVTMIATSKWHNGGPVRVEFQNLRLDEEVRDDDGNDVCRPTFQQTLAVAKPALKHCDGWRPVKVKVYLSEDTTDDEHRRVHDAVFNAFVAEFPGTKPQIQIEYRQRKPIDVTELTKAIDEAVAAVEAKNPGVDVARQIRVEMARAQRRIEELAQNTYARTTTPEEAKRLVSRFAMMRFGISIALRTMQALGLTTVPATQNMGASMLVTAVEGAREWVFTRYRQELQGIFARFGITGYAADKVVAEAEKEYDNVGWRQFVNRLTNNYLLGSIAIPITMQYLSAFTGVVEQVTLERAGMLAANGVVGAGAYSLANDAAGRFHRKGYASLPFIETVFQTAGLSDVVSQIAMSLPAATAALTAFTLRVPGTDAAVPYLWTQAVLWSGYIGAEVASFAVPDINRYYVLVDDRLLTREDIDQMEATNGAHVLQPTTESVESFAARAEQKYPRSHTHNRCSRAFTALGRWVRGK